MRRRGALVVVVSERFERREVAEEVRAIPEDVAAHVDRRVAGGGAAARLEVRDARVGVEAKRLAGRLRKLLGVERGADADGGHRVAARPERDRLARGAARKRGEPRRVRAVAEEGRAVARVRREERGHVVRAVAAVGRRCHHLGAHLDAAHRRAQHLAAVARRALGDHALAAAAEQPHLVEVGGVNRRHREVQRRRLVLAQPTDRRRDREVARGALRRRVDAIHRIELELTKDDEAVGLLERRQVDRAAVVGVGRHRVRPVDAQRRALDELTRGVARQVRRRDEDGGAAELGARRRAELGRLRRHVVRKAGGGGAAAVARALVGQLEGGGRRELLAVERHLDRLDARRAERGAVAAHRARVPQRRRALDAPRRVAQRHKGRRLARAHREGGGVAHVGRVDDGDVAKAAEVVRSAGEGDAAHANVGGAVGGSRARRERVEARRVVGRVVDRRRRELLRVERHLQTEGAKVEARRRDAAEHVRRRAVVRRVDRRRPKVRPLLPLVVT